MKKCVLLGCMVTSLMCAMENNSKTFIYKGTTIIVTKDPIGQRDKEIHAIIAGRNAQEKLEQNGTGTWIPTLHRVQERDYLYIKNKDSEMVHEYKPYTSLDDKQWKNAYSKKMNNKIVTISEPCIRKSKYRFDEKKEIFLQDYMYIYACEKEHSKCEMHGNAALEEALKDLDACYKIVLREVFKKLSGKENKKIACLPLGIHVGFPLQQAAGIAAKALSDFIKDNSKAYESVVFCVENQYEFDAYVNEFKNLMQ